MDVDIGTRLPVSFLKSPKIRSFRVGVPGELPSVPVSSAPPFNPSLLVLPVLFKYRVSLNIVYRTDPRHILLEILIALSNRIYALTYILRYYEYSLLEGSSNTLDGRHSLTPTLTLALDLAAHFFLITYFS